MSYDPNDFQDQAAIAAMLQRQRMINSQNQQQSIPKNRQCPWCGGLLPGQYSKCQHCASEVSWVDGLPYKPQEAEYRERLSFEKWEKEEKRKAEIAAKKKKFEEALDARVVNCKKCSCRVPQTDLISTVDTCKKCADREKFIYKIVFIAVLTVIVTLITALRAKHEQKQFLEAKAKLAAEIGAGRVGSILDVPLVGKGVIPFAFCPTGSFTMGEDARLSDKNVNVTLTKGFWMARTELTQAQWKAIIDNIPQPSDTKGEDLPVENVSWRDAQAFIKKVNDNRVIPEGWKMALPTEAQWEYACRAGETGAYSVGTIDQVAWYNENSGGKTHPVGTKKPNAWGLHDMHGNVWEWCADWYDDSLRGDTDPSGPSSGVFRVYRGGSTCDEAVRCRSACRERSEPHYRKNHRGFRPVLVPSE